MDAVKLTSSGNCDHLSDSRNRTIVRIKYANARATTENHSANQFCGTRAYDGEAKTRNPFFGKALSALKNPRCGNVTRNSTIPASFRIRFVIKNKTRGD